jgi:hypothetical protein
MANRSAGPVKGGNDGKVEKGSRGKITVFKFSKSQINTGKVGSPSEEENATVGGTVSQVKPAKF